MDPDADAEYDAALYDFRIKNSSAVLVNRKVHWEALDDDVCRHSTLDKVI